MDKKDLVYLEVAKKVAELSKDKNTHVGCVIIDKQGAVVSTGRNGTVAGFNDSEIPHSRENETINFYENDIKIELETNKYFAMIHGEGNALFYGDKSRIVGSTMYVTGMPCPQCALQIAQHKVAKVVIPEDWNNIAMIKEEDIKLSKFIFAQAGIVFQIHDTIINLESNTEHSNFAMRLFKKSGGPWRSPFGFGRDLPPKY